MTQKVLVLGFNSYSFIWVHREANAMVDALSKFASF
jgi:hypothetical protein